MKHEKADSPIEDDEFQTPQTPRKRVRATKSETNTPSRSRQTSSFTPEQDARLFELYAQKTRLNEIHKIFMDEYGYQGNEKALKNRYFKMKDQHTTLTDDEVCLNIGTSSKGEGERKFGNYHLF